MQFCRVRKAIEMCSCIPHDAPDVNFDSNANVCKNSGAGRYMLELFLDQIEDKYHV